MAVSETHSSLTAPIDVELGGVLLANMLEGWLQGNPNFSATAEATDEPQDSRSSPEPACLHLPTPVDAWSGTPSSGEHGAPVCTAREGAGTRLERIPDPHTGTVAETGTEMTGRTSETLVADVPMGQTRCGFCIEVAVARSTWIGIGCWGLLLLTTTWRNTKMVATIQRTSTTDCCSG
jgi:hypothetical protein